MPTDYTYIQYTYIRTIRHNNNQLEWRRIVLQKLVSIEKVPNILIYYI